jgi:predicted PurR-regulated permease PerM
MSDNQTPAVPPHSTDYAQTSDRSAPPRQPTYTAHTTHPPFTSEGAQQVMPGVQRFVLSGAAIALGILGLYAGQSLLIPLALAALLAFVLAPLVTWLRRWSVPRGLAVGAVITVTLALIAGAGVMTAQQVGELGRELPTHRHNIQKKLRDLRPALVPSGATREVARLMGMVEGEFDAAKEGLQLGDKKPTARVTRVAVEPEKQGPITWTLLTSLGVQLGTAALVVILLVFMLLQRRELRDRLLRLMGGDMHLMADALTESAARVSRYLLAQVMVNLGYGLPMALGLWWIGVPGAWLWGGLAAVLRFVPYLGPAMGAIFPLVMAFAVDPGWSMVFWTVGLIATLELISNNIVEPLAYGGSTGVSPLAVLISAAFWASLWGPMGLVLATPLTVCLVVIGRHLAPLRFLDVLLSGEPVFDEPTQLYHRLISGDFDEAEDLAFERVKHGSLMGFYNDTALPMLALAHRQNAQGATPAHRHRVLAGTARMVEELRADDGTTTTDLASEPALLCVGLRSEMDALSADMLAHAFVQQGRAALAVPMGDLMEGALARSAWSKVQTIHLCTLSATPQTQARQQCRRLRRLWPHAPIHLVGWCVPEALTTPDQAQAMGVDAVFTQLQVLVDQTPKQAAADHPPDDDWPADGTGARRPLEAPSPTSAPPQPEPPQQARLARAVQRAADAFGVAVASLTLKTPGPGVRCVIAGMPERTGWHTEAMPAPMSPVGRVLAGEGTLRLSDLHSDPRHLGASHAIYRHRGFFAGVPLLDAAGRVAGALALHAPAGHTLSAVESGLLAQLALDMGAEGMELISALENAVEPSGQRVFSPAAGPAPGEACAPA